MMRIIALDHWVSVCGVTGEATDRAQDDSTFVPGLSECPNDCPGCSTSLIFCFSTFSCTLPPISWQFSQRSAGILAYLREPPIHLPIRHDPRLPPRQLQPHPESASVGDGREEGDGVDEWGGEGEEELGGDPGCSGGPGGWLVSGVPAGLDGGGLTNDTGAGVGVSKATRMR